MNQQTLFDGNGIGRYPQQAGFKERGGTSEEAAREINSAGNANRLRAMVLDMLRLRGPLTADEIATACGESVLSIRPRCSELVGMGLVRKTPERRVNRSGKRAAVLRLKQAGE